MKKPPTAFEAEILEIVLVELRRAMRKREQLSVLIDPFARGDGAYIFAAPNERGHTYEVQGAALGHQSSVAVSRRYGRSTPKKKGRRS